MVFILFIVMYCGEKVLYTCDRVFIYRGVGVVYIGYGDICIYIVISKYEV